MNPYETPTTVNEFFGGCLWTMRVGATAPHVVSVHWSLWKGIRTFVTDAAGNRGPVYRGPVELEFGQREVHSVQIKVDEVGKVAAYVDGVSVDANLFPDLQDRIWKSVLAGVVVFATVLTIAVLGGLVYFF